MTKDIHLPFTISQFVLLLYLVFDVLILLGTYNIDWFGLGIFLVMLVNGFSSFIFFITDLNYIAKWLLAPVYFPIYIFHKYFKLKLKEEE